MSRSILSLCPRKTALNGWKFIFCLYGWIRHVACHSEDRDHALSWVSNPFRPPMHALHDIKHPHNTHHHCRLLLCLGCGLKRAIRHGTCVGGGVFLSSLRGQLSDGKILEIYVDVFRWFDVAAAGPLRLKGASHTAHITGLAHRFL